MLVGPTDGPAVFSGYFNECHSLHQQIYCTFQLCMHAAPICGNGLDFEALAAGLYQLYSQPNIVVQTVKQGINSLDTVEYH